MDLKTYINQIYGLLLKYPSNWKPSKKGSHRYEGEDGFFQVSLISSKKSIDDVAGEDANHPLKPYGSRPRIIPYEVQGRPARIILPSEDQPPSMDNQTAIIIRYRQPVFIEPNLYNYLIIWMDDQHLETILKSIYLFNY